MKEITLFKGQKCLVDDEWYPVLSKVKWHMSGKGYAQRCAVPGASVMMHQVIAMTPRSLTTDHINGDKLDNRSENLRVCKNSENCRSKGKHKDNTTGYKGVTRRPKGNYQASITVDSKMHYLGVFTTKEEAARAYDVAAKKLHGRFASLNFKDE